MEGKVRQENPESPEMMDGEKAHKYIAAMLENLAEDDVCAVFMINLDNTEEIRERFGEQEELAAESRAEQILSSMFIGTDIVSRIGKSEFFVFTLWRAGEKEVAGKAEEICRRLRECGGGSGCPLCASTGAYMAKTQGQTFDSLFGFAAAALYEAKKRGSGSWYVLANETEAKGTAGEEAARPISGLTLNAFLDCLEGGVCLIEAGQELRVVFASSGFYRMTDRLPEQMSVPCGIDELGIHPDYEADYEQALKAAGESGEGFEHIHRIAEDGNRWIWRHVKVQSVPYPASRYPVLLEVSRDISKSVETEKKLCENNERLRIAFRQIPNVLWEVDISARTYNIYDVDAQMCRPETEIGDFPRSFVEKGLVHRDSAENFLGFANRMISGKNAEVGNFIMKDPSGSGYGWVSMSYYMMFDRNGAPEKAVGLQTKLPAISGITPGAFPRRPLPEAVRHHILVRIKANLTADYVDSVWTHGSDRTAWTWGRTYTQVMKNRSVRLFREAERREFDRRFSRENLLEDFRKGRVWTAGEYQSVDDGGSIRWISAAINLQEDPQSGEVYMFACITDSQQRHMWEMGMKNGVFRDPDTGLYDLTTARNMSEYILSRSGNMECAVALIRMIYGEEPGFMERTEDEALRRSRQSIAAALSLALGGDCVIGNYKAGMIYVFFPQAESRFELKKQIEDAFAYVRVTMDGSDEINKLRFVAGVVTEQQDNADISSMIFRAGYLCEMWKNSAMDTAVFPSEDEDWAWAGLRGDQPDNAVSIGKAEIRPLSQEEQEAVFRCVTLMLKSGSLEDSLNNVLQRIGKFYRAARTYLLTLSEDRQTVVMRGEWMESGRQSIRYILSGVGISQIPVLEKCLREKNTVFIESPMNRLTRAVRDEGKWNFMVFPLTRKSEITSFFCIENTREHQSETLVLRTLQPYITGEQNRFEMLAARMNAANHDALPLLPNLTSYMEVVCSLDSDAYSSMGALSVDVPNFQALTGSFGFEYGRKMLMFISDTLTGIFGKAFIFRTWDAEFVVLFPDTIREVFNGRCNRLRTVLQRRYPHQIRIGSVWSGGVFEARNLVREAQMVMRSDDVETRERTVDQENAKYQMISREFSVKKFIPYFQPKVDMRDGSVTGAEALVRGVDSDGNTISPGVFIEAMERDGTIRELDLFMLDAVFQQLSEWKEKGDRVLPVSVNMSRVTLFNPTTLASVLAIQSRYPELEEGLVELEITETGSDMEKATLADIVNNFRECGMQFELDDFGSGYANISLFSNIRFHTIKLDRSLVNDLPENEISSMLVENITQICRNFGMNCIAEGVETRQQAEELMKAGCNYAQGFYYAKPLPADEFRKRYLEPNVAAQV